MCAGTTADAPISRQLAEPVSTAARNASLSKVAVLQTAESSSKSRSQAIGSAARAAPALRPRQRPRWRAVRPATRSAIAAVRGRRARLRGCLRRRLPCATKTRSIVSATLPAPSGRQTSPVSRARSLCPVIPPGGDTTPDAGLHAVIVGLHIPGQQLGNIVNRQHPALFLVPHRPARAPPACVAGDQTDAPCGGV